MARPRRTAKLSDILQPMPYMKIVIDESVSQDDDGNYRINVGYLRVSTDKQADEGYGLDIQEQKVVACAVSLGMKNLVLFIDDGYTGTKMTERPALGAVMHMIERFNDGLTRIRIDTFVVPRMDRLGRTLLGTLQFIQDYIICAKDAKQSTVNRNKEDINFLSVAEPSCSVSSGNAQGKFLLMLFASLAEYDRDLIVRKLKDGMLARVAEGKWPGGGMTPYGYRYSEKEDTLLIIPEEADKIREVFRLYIEEKMPPQKIADRLGFKGEKVVTNILRRKSLTGCISYKGKEYPGLHEPIIPLERWEEAQQELQNRSVYRADSQHLLSGLLYCGECGTRMRYQKWNKYGACKLVCYSTQRSARETKAYMVRNENCPQVTHWAEEIESAVVQTLFEMHYLGDEQDQKSDSFVNTMDILMQELKTVNSKLSRLYNLDEDDDDILLEKIQQFKARKKELEAQIEKEAAQGILDKQVQKVRSVLVNLRNQWPHMNAMQRQSIIRELVSKVVIFQTGEVQIVLKLESFLRNNTQTSY